MATAINIIKELDKINYQKYLKVRAKKLTNGGYSVYLDIWHNGKRQYIFLKIRLQNIPSSRDSDIDLLRLAIAIRDKKEIELISNSAGFEVAGSGKADFLAYFQYCLSKREKEAQNHINGNWYGTQKKLVEFSNNRVTFADLDYKFCKRFLEFLQSKDYKPATVQSMYCSIFKGVLNRAVRDGIIPKNPADGLTVPVPDSERQFLTFEELKQLISTPCNHPEVSAAFLFSCWTGLRHSDLKNLSFDQIKDGYIGFKQAKTGGVERIKLSENALAIIERRQVNNHGKCVFKVPHLQWVNRQLKLWVLSAGITKHISFHCARHTFATLCLTYDIDLFTVSKLLGHRDIKTTQIYAKLIDKKKDEAIDKLPKI